jgi:hypothetical protein
MLGGLRRSLARNGAEWRALSRDGRPVDAPNPRGPRTIEGVTNVVAAWPFHPQMSPASCR